MTDQQPIVSEEKFRVTRLKLDGAYEKLKTIQGAFQKMNEELNKIQKLGD